MDSLKVYPDGQVTASHRRKFNPDRPIEKKELTLDQKFNLAMMRIDGILTAIAVLRAAAPWVYQTSVTPTKPKKKRGIRGMTAEGRKTTRNVAVLIERGWRRKCCSFATLTLPPEYQDIPGKVFSYAIALFKKRIQYVQRNSNLPPVLIGVIENQKKRYQETGKVALHAHIVFVGRRPNSGWILRPCDITRMWQECVLSAVRWYECNHDDRVTSTGEEVTSKVTTSRPSNHRSNENNDCNNGKGNGNGTTDDSAIWNAATNIQRIKKSVAAYLAKYITKGSSETQEIIAAGMENQLPSAWYFTTRYMLERYRRSITQISGYLAHEVFESLQSNAAALLIYSKYVKITDADGYEHTVGWYGYLSKAGKAEFALLRECSG